MTMMTKTAAIEYVRNCDEDEGPETYEDAAELFAAIFGRAPGHDDGDQGELWSHVCAAVPTEPAVDSEAPTAALDADDGVAEYERTDSDDRDRRNALQLAIVEAGLSGLSWERDADTGSGLVARMSSRDERAGAIEKLKAAGIETSSSEDDAGALYLWAVAR